MSYLSLTTRGVSRMPSIICVALVSLPLANLAGVDVESDVQVHGLKITLKSVRHNVHNALGDGVHDYYMQQSKYYNHKDTIGQLKYQHAPLVEELTGIKTIAERLEELKLASSTKYTPTTQTQGQADNFVPLAKAGQFLAEKNREDSYPKGTTGTASIDSLSSTGTFEKDGAAKIAGDWLRFQMLRTMDDEASEAGYAEPEAHAEEEAHLSAERSRLEQWLAQQEMEENESVDGDDDDVVVDETPVMARERVRSTSILKSGNPSYHSKLKRVTFPIDEKFPTRSKKFSENMEEWAKRLDSEKANTEEMLEKDDLVKANTGGLGKGGMLEKTLRNGASLVSRLSSRFRIKLRQ